MTGNDELPCILYGSDLHPKEKTALKRMESAISDILLEYSTTASPHIWTQSTNIGPRALQLFVIADLTPQVLVEILADKIDSLSQEELISLIKENITNDQ